MALGPQGPGEVQGQTLGQQAKLCGQGPSPASVHVQAGSPGAGGSLHPQETEQ